MNLLDDFVEAIEFQQEKQEVDFDEQMNLPEAERVAKGITMSGLKIEVSFHKDLLNLSSQSGGRLIKSVKVICKANISKFREGANVILSNGQYNFPMDIIEDDINNFILTPNDWDWSQCYIPENYNPNNWEINAKKINITLRLLMATHRHLVNSENKTSEIESILEGDYNVSYNESSSKTILNLSQNEAINKSIGTNKFHLIQGPPGTGKTETIAHLAKKFVDEGKKIFITGPTHTAINNCLNAISSQIKNPSKVVKIGQKYQANEIIDNGSITMKDRLTLSTYLSDESFAKDGIAIGGTPYCMCYPASKRLNNWEFDIAIIDEAAQLSIPLAVAVMSKAEKYIFVGDHKQLDPIIPKNTDNLLFDGSIFWKLISTYPEKSSLLNTSYRLNQDLIKIPNKLFYQNQLSSADDLKIDKTVFNSNEFSNVLNGEDSLILFLHKEFDSLGRSVHEGKIVAKLIHDLIKNQVPENEIAILTPYRAQVREIKKQVAEICGINIAKKLFIDTVDRMQGQERNYCIYSMSNSHPLQSKRRLSFFYNPNRLNVAISRARNKCIVIANYKVFDIIDEELRDEPNYELLKPNLLKFKEFKELATIVEETSVVEEW